MNNKPVIDEASLSHWLSGLRAGEDRATSKLWRMYFERMVILARRKLDGAKRSHRDEEDIALSAFKSFCLGLRGGKFHTAPEPDNLWPLLVTLTINKAIDHIRRENRKKRGGTANKEFHKLGNLELLDQLAATEPSPELVLAANESFEKLLASLDRSGDDSLKQIAILRMNDTAPEEIATRLKCTVRTVQRKLKTIRALWESGNA